MKKLFISCCLAMSVTGIFAQNYQLPNSNFEGTWTKNSKGETYTEDTPEKWNSFFAAKGQMAQLAFLMKDQTGTVIQGLGRNKKGSSAIIVGRKNFYGTISNGNLTTGYINMGSTTASDKSNYNYSAIADPNGSCEFAGLPDAVEVYFRFHPVAAAKGKAGMTMILHSEYEFKDPSGIMTEEDIQKYTIARASVAIDSLNQWKKYTVPFEYNGENYKAEGKKFMLASFTTNQLPGEGSTGDTLAIDDIKMIYNSSLTSISIAGKEFKDFDPNIMQYNLNIDELPTLDNIKLTTDGKGATTEVKVMGSEISVTVKGANFAEDNKNLHVYYFVCSLPEKAVFQLPNSNFEGEWTTHKSYSASDLTTVCHMEETPAYWNSFFTAQGDYARLALNLMANQAGTVLKTAGKGKNNSAALIVSRANLMGSVSNGNLTTGYINMGSMTAADKHNYNYTDTAKAGGSCLFGGLPDAVEVEFRFHPVTAATGKGSMVMVLHSAYDYKDPSGIMSQEDIQKYTIARASVAIDSLNTWKKYTVPFEYTGENYKTAGKKYLLASFSTNEKPGIGTAGDTLAIDNIKMIYNSSLTSITVAGMKFDKFQENVYQYDLNVDELPSVENITVETDGKGAQAEIVVKGREISVVVKGNNYEEDKKNMHVYYFVCSLPEEAVYQLPNSDFEGEWTTHKAFSASDLVTVCHMEETPEYWNSFFTAKGDFARLALNLMANQAGTVLKTQGNGEGSAALIVSRANLMGSVSNGNLTTGYINMGSMTAADKNNYNYTDTKLAGGSCQFGGLPDAVEVDFRFRPVTAAKGKGSMVMILHSDYNFKDPSGIMTEDEISKYTIARAEVGIDSLNQWKRYTVPFVYNGENYKAEGKNFMLASFSTNQKPGVGTAGDTLAIDNIKMVYNSSLESLTIANKAVEGFEKDVYSYNLKGNAPAASEIAAVSDGKGATVETTVEGNQVIIVVKGNDYAVNNNNTHTYTLNFGDTGIAENGLAAVEVAGINGGIVVANALDMPVEVYSVQGVLVANFVANDAQFTINGLNNQTLYIVKVGSKVVRVLTK